MNLPRLDENAVRSGRPEQYFISYIHITKYNISLQNSVILMDDMINYYYVKYLNIILYVL